MTRKAKIGMLLVLVMCVMFAMLLSELNTQARQNNTAEEQKILSAEYYSRAPVTHRVGDRPRIRESSIRPVPRHQMLAANNAGQRRTATPRPVNRQPVQRRIHIVESGETLTKIAKKYYGNENGMLYRLILQANTDTLDNPNKLTIGMKLLIPPKPSDR